MKPILQEQDTALKGASSAELWGRSLQVDPCGRRHFEKGSIYPIFFPF